MEQQFEQSGIFNKKAFCVISVILPVCNKYTENKKENLLENYKMCGQIKKT